MLREYFCLAMFLFFSNQLNSAQSQRINSQQTVRQRLTLDAILSCNYSKEEKLEQIEWWYKRFGGIYIGDFNATSRLVNTNWTRDGDYQIVDNGSLLIHNVRRELVERYECLATFVNGQQSRAIVFLRLDFSFWYAPEPFSLFYGSCIFALIFCVASFLINIFWILIRWSVLRWIKRTERLSRVRAMLVAMEKYGQRQMESLHEGYNRRMSAVRENYHNQKETIRNSYLESADRFRDYRQARIDNVQQHLDVYYQQIARLREYGHKRVEHLWESYEKSVTAVRTFTLEQRLKILNQSKVKQRYLNKLLEAIGTETNVDIISKKEAAIRAVLGDEEPPLPIFSFNDQREENLNLIFPPRSSSFHSLPEFPLEEIEENNICIDIRVKEKEINNLIKNDEEEKEYLLLLQQQQSTSNASNIQLIKNIL